jgi:hypothetical protein
MKIHYLVGLALCLSFCSEKTETKPEFINQFSVSLDTVRINSGGEFIDLRDNLFFSALSPDKSYLINFNRTELEGERINLDELIFEKRIKYEKEGPNGIGDMISYLKLIVNTVFSPGTDVTCKLPRCRFIICLDMAKPIPDPVFLVV